MQSTNFHFLNTLFETLLKDEGNRIVANSGSTIVLYTTEDGNTQLEVKLEQDTVWLTQNPNGRVM